MNAMTQTFQPVARPSRGDNAHLQEQARADRALWVSVASVVLADAVRDVGKEVACGAEIAQAVQRQMRYFRSKDWAMVCDLAGISGSIGMVEKYLTETISRQASIERMQFNVHGRQVGGIKDAARALRLTVGDLSEMIRTALSEGVAYIVVKGGRVKWGGENV